VDRFAKMMLKCRDCRRGIVEEEEEEEKKMKFV
jgi:hypothetical protein